MLALGFPFEVLLKSFGLSTTSNANRPCVRFLRLLNRSASRKVTGCLPEGHCLGYQPKNSEIHHIV